jgi:Tfp pilus assembly protein PilO
MVDRIPALTLKLDALRDEEEEIRNDIIWEASNKRNTNELEEQLRELEHTIKIVEQQLKQNQQEKERA